MESVSLILSTISALPRVHATEKRKNLPIEGYEHPRVPSTEGGLWLRVNGSISSPNGLLQNLNSLRLWSVPTFQTFS